ncbi:MAG TPA: hypothetical protein ENI37_06285 [Chloroflexi bacterium]|nr:hypothetical protein [Chloroflexota bacterium]
MSNRRLRPGNCWKKLTSGPSGLAAAPPAVDELVSIWKRCTIEESVEGLEALSGPGERLALLVASLLEAWG